MVGREEMVLLLQRRGWEFPSLTAELTTRLGYPFLVFGSLFYLLVLGRGRIAWQRTWTSLLVAGLIGYAAADLLFPRFYISVAKTGQSPGQV